MNPDSARSRPRGIYIACVAMGVLAVAGFAGHRYFEYAEAQEIAAWETRLKLAAQGRAAGIARLLQEQARELRELGSNVSLRTYLWRTVESARETPDRRPAEFGYLRNQLVAQSAGGRDDGPIGATRTLVLLDPELELLFAADGAPPRSELLDIAGRAADNRTLTIALTPDTPEQASRLLLATPVAPPPGALDRPVLSGVLVAAYDTRVLAANAGTGSQDFFSSDANLLHSDTGSVVVLGGPPELTANPAGATRTAADPAFAHLDLGGRTVLEAREPVAKTGLVLAHRVDAEAALQPLMQRLWSIGAALACALLFLAALYWALRERTERVEQSRALTISGLGGVDFASLKDQETLRSLMTALADIIDMHDPHSAHHSARLTELSRAIGIELGLDEQSLNTLVLAATFANVGKITLPQELLAKQEALTQEERQRVRAHVEKGAELLRGLDVEPPVIKAIEEKQEHLDGSGYPHGITADEMTEPGKILAVANAFVALVSPRAYRRAMTSGEALAAIRAHDGDYYDHRAVAALEKVIARQSDWSPTRNVTPDSASG